MEMKNLNLNFNSYPGNLKNLPLIISFILSFSFLLIASKSSPLYPFNDWSDANASFTMGKAMMEGKILYKDIFNQKGSFYYLIHGIAYLISPRSFFGVFLFETAFFTVFLYYGFRISRLVMGINSSLALLPFLAYIVLNMKSFSHGDSAEEYGAAFLMVSLFYLFAYLYHYESANLRPNLLFVNGIIAGCVLWIKFSMLGFWLGWIFIIFLGEFIKGEYRNSIRNCCWFLAGILLATIPWILYFGFNHAIEDWIESYFLINLKYYNKMPNNDGNLFELPGTLKNLLIQNMLFTIISSIGLISLIFRLKITKNKLKALAIIFPFFVLLFSVFGGGRKYPYYLYIFSPFCVFGLIFLIKYFQKYLKLIKLKTIYLTTGIITAFFMLLTFLYNQNTYLIAKDKNDLMQFSFLQKINDKPDISLFNLGILDQGLNTTTGIVPNVRFFQLQNIPVDNFPLNIEEQISYLKEKKSDYILTTRECAQYRLFIPLLNENYHLIAQQLQSYEDSAYNFELYKANP